MAGYRWWRRLTDGRRGVVALVATAGLIALTGGWLAGRASPEGRVGPLGWALLLISVLALARVRRFPRSVLAVTMAAAAAYYSLGFPPGPEPLGFVVALYHVSAAGRRALAIIAAAASVVAVELTELAVDAALETDDLFPVLAWLAVVIVLGEVGRSRRGVRGAGGAAGGGRADA